MPYSNFKFRNDQYCLLGQKDEDFVANLLTTSCGGETYKSNFQEDTQQHIDLWWTSPKKGKLGIDVKGIRKNHRKDTNTDDTINWIEIKSVLGTPGWIYGDAYYIAFLTHNDVIFVKTKHLQKYAENIIQNKEVVNVCPDECYIPYQRKGRKDLIFKCPTLDLRELSTKGGFIINIQKT